ncbi:MAG: cob(I)yrinic acid a,c-diamide adenosyltransferase [Candidatus Kerfeldbacteria bacterium]|nr:cob(I)yrinic acid a,c-diamide adenosyltransferase [Candidatus Kerfeldbacteria bacterium]
MPVHKAPKKLRPADRGLTHAYIGDGKGKTTAAVGVAVRAAGYGWRVSFIQFMKSPPWPSGERQSLRKLGVEVLVLGEGFYKILNDRKPEEQHQAAALKALAVLRKKVFSGQYQLVVADELGSAVEEQILDRQPVEKFLKDRAQDKKAKMVHLIWTGHQKIKWMLKYADLVTEMKMIKHPYYKGIIATRGLDY